MPALSVLMPVKDGSSTLHTSVMDVLRGLQPADEIVIVDDGSRDQTPQVIRELEAMDSRVRSLTTDGVGLAQALNLGAMNCSHDWIARADADDRYPQHRFEVQRQATGGQVALIAGDYAISAGARSLGVIPCALGAPFVALSLLNPQRVAHPGVLMSRTALLEAGMYRESDFPAEDLGLWLRLMLVGDFIGVPAVVVNWRMSSSSTSATRQTAQRQMTAHLLRDFPHEILSRLGVSSIERELQSYDEFEYAAERSMLLLRDLFAARKRGVNVPAKFLTRVLTTRPLQNARSVASLAIERRRRSAFRRALRTGP